MADALVSTLRGSRSPVNEHGLVGAAKKGDLDAFNQLVLSYQSLVYHHVSAIVRDDPLADDITQIAFIKAYQGLAHYRNGSFRAWLLRIATNACYDELRRQKRQQTLPLNPMNMEDEENESPEWLLDDSVSIEKRVEQRELGVWLKKHLDQIPEEFRAAMVLVDVWGLDYNEASQALSVPMGTVKSRLARGRMRMHERLTASPEYAQLSM